MKLDDLADIHTTALDLLQRDGVVYAHELARDTGVLDSVAIELLLVLQAEGACRVVRKVYFMGCGPAHLIEERAYALGLPVCPFYSKVLGHNVEHLRDLRYSVVAWPEGS